MLFNGTKSENEFYGLISNIIKYCIVWPFIIFFGPFLLIAMLVFIVGCVRIPIT